MKREQEKFENWINFLSQSSKNTEVLIHDKSGIHNTYAFPNIHERKKHTYRAKEATVTITPSNQWYSFEWYDFWYSMGFFPPIILRETQHAQYVLTMFIPFLLFQKQQHTLTRTHRTHSLNCKYNIELSTRFLL